MPAKIKVRRNMYFKDLKNTLFLLIRKRDHDRRVPERPHKNGHK